MNRFGRLVGQWLLVVLIASLLGACTQQSIKDANQVADQRELENMTLILDWYPNAIHSFLYTAQEKGYFADEGLKVDFRPPADTNDPLKLVASGKVELAFSYQNQIVTARSQGLPVVSVAAIVQKPLTQLMVADDAGISRPIDLEGKKIGYSSIELYKTFVETMVKTDGGNPEKVEFIDIGWDLIPAMLTRRVDGIMGGFINHEQPILAKEGMNVKIIKGADYGLPDYYELVLVANEERMKTNRDSIEKFVNAMRKGFADMMADPQTSLDLLLTKEMKEFPLKSDIEKKSLDMLMPLMDAGAEPYGTQTLESWQEAADWMYQNGAIEKKIDASKAFVNM